MKIALDSVRLALAEAISSVNLAYSRLGAQQEEAVLVVDDALLEDALVDDDYYRAIADWLDRQLIAIGRAS